MGVSKVSSQMYGQHTRLYIGKQISWLNRIGWAQAHQNVVSIGGKQTFQCVNLRDFLTELAKAVKWNPASWDNLQRMYVSPSEVCFCSISL